MNNKTSKSAKQLIAEVLNETAEFLTTGSSLAKIKVGITVLGSEHGINEVIKGAELAQNNLSGVEVVVIGPADTPTNLTKAVAADETACHAKMEELLKTGDIDAAVTMHYNFPIGTSTIGLVVTPGLGKKMFIATTTGTSATDRVESLVKNAVYGTAVAKAYGIKAPKLGILNIDGARQTERILNQLKANGYPLAFSESQRSDGGPVMRGNDLLAGVPDVMITDSLTGNLLVKMLSAYTTGGSYEAVGYGYGPGVGDGFDRIINIISRASGAPVIARAIEYAAAMAKGNLVQISLAENSAAKKAGLNALLQSNQPTQPSSPQVEIPPQKVVCQQIAGIDVLELDNAQHTLWKHNIYAETGMGCTGPIILVSTEDYNQAIIILKQNKYII